MGLHVYTRMHMSVYYYIILYYIYYIYIILYYIGPETCPFLKPLCHHPLIHHSHLPGDHFADFTLIVAPE